MTELEEYYLDRLISEHNLLEKYEAILADCEDRCCKLEKQICDIFGTEKAEEMFEQYKVWRDNMENEQ